MTASRNKASRAVTAALVGVLSVGAVPMVAVAAESGATPLLAETTDQLADSSIVEAADQDGQGVDLGSEVRFAKDGSAHYVVPTAVQNSVNGETTYLTEANGYSVNYYVPAGKNVDASETVTLSDGTKVNYFCNAEEAREKITDVGTYYAVVVTGSDATAAATNCFVKFEIVDTRWDDAYVCDGTDATDTVIEYDGTEQWFSDGDLSLVLNGTVYNLEGLKELLKKNDWGNLKCFVAGSTDTASSDSPEDAGDYVLRILDADGVYHYVDFTISPLDISTSAIVLDQPAYELTTEQLPTSVESVGGVTVDEEGKIGTATIVLTAKDPSVAPVEVTPGVYVYTVSATDAKGNVVGTQDVTVVRYETAAEFTYNRMDITNGYDLGSAVFDPSAVQAVDSVGSKLDVSITYKTQTGTVLGDELPTTPGNYVAVITAVDDTYKYGGQTTVEFCVNATMVKVSDIYAYYRGTTLQKAEVEDIYDGTDLVQNLTVSATDEDGNAVPEGELELVVTDSDGNVVEGAVEAGTYTVTIKAVDGSGYLVEGDADTIELTVDPVTVDDNQDSNAQLRLVGTMGYGTEPDTTYLYTGSAVTPTFEYDLTAEMWGYDKSVDWVGLPESVYNVRYQQLIDVDDEGNEVWDDVDECVEPGTYRAVLTDAKSDSYVVNANVTFKITATKVFADVDNDDWYSSYVWTAASDEFRYIFGYDNGNFFGPNDSINRADVVMVIWRMAGTPGYNGSEGSTDNKTYDLPYTDVDESAYYAQALQWATKLGIVSGDGDSQETFRPGVPVTREELAKMLYKYMELQGETEDVDEDAILGAYDDADSVSEWAEEYVAWLVDQGVMGQGSGLEGDRDITRAEVATMAVRLQPAGRLTQNDFLQ